MSTLKYADCIAECNRCADICDYCATSCLSEENVAMMARCIRLDMDCAAQCRIAAGVMARESEHAVAICQLCAQICEACAEECEKHDHQHCKQCASACRQCANACFQMAA